MPSYKPRVTVYTDEETNLKLAYIAKLENRSSSNYTEFLIKKAIKEYEEENGKLQIIEKEVTENGIIKLLKIVTGVSLGEYLGDKINETRGKTSTK